MIDVNREEVEKLVKALDGDRAKITDRIDENLPQFLMTFGMHPRIAKFDAVMKVVDELIRTEEKADEVEALTVSLHRSVVEMLDRMAAACGESRESACRRMLEANARLYIEHGRIL